jgi:hypothetical protein
MTKLPHYPSEVVNQIWLPQSRQTVGDLGTCTTYRSKSLSLWPEHFIIVGLQELGCCLSLFCLFPVATSLADFYRFIVAAFLTG